ncbi:MAG: SDR family NAD(P)-dependent oxidoreductase [Myxococcales bacterium]|nr:SDR family NAD(P)-dependent oxidoreductase [Myxococcales bacterium]
MTPQPSRIVLVTGATGGIGQATVLALLAGGHRVVATGRDPSALLELRSRARDAGRALEVLELDVTAPASIAEARADLLARGVSPDVIVHAAGLAELGPLMITAEPALERHFATNVIGAMAVNRAFLGDMRARRSGRIIHVGAVVDRLTLATHGAYGSSMYALRALNDTLRQELRPFGVDVVLVEPGTVRTGFLDGAFDGLDAKRTEGSRWNGVIDRLQWLKRAVTWIGVPPERVATVLVRAVEAPKPRRRYVVTAAGTGVQLGAKHLLPTRTFDRVVRATLGLARRVTSPAPSEMPVALVTGAAGRLGGPATLALARAGHRVIATDVDEVGLARIATKARGLPVETLRLDVTQPRSVGEALREIDARTEGRGVDVLVSAAGFVDPAPMDLVDLETWQRTFAVNAVGAMRVTRAVAQRMCDRGGGRIVHVSSVAGVMAFPFVGPYQASKFALEALSDALRQELHPFGVDVVLVEPSFIADGFAARVRARVEASGDAGAHWAPVLPHLEAIEGRLAVLGGDAEQVAAVVVEAATTLEPVPRYPAPWTAALAVRTEAWMPAAVTDRLFHELFALRNVEELAGTST